jgi:hypothetical protein
LVPPPNLGFEFSYERARQHGIGLFAERECRIRLLAERSSLPKAYYALESQVLGVGTGHGRPFEAGGLGLGELKVDRPRQMSDTKGSAG